MVAQAQTRLQALIDERARPMLNQWFVQAMADRAMDRASAIVAHLAYLHRNSISAGQIDANSVKTLLIAQCFLKMYYKFDLDVDQGLRTLVPSAAGAGARRTKDMESQIDTALGIPQVELFGLFQAVRNRMMTWMDDNSSEKVRPNPCPPLPLPKGCTRTADNHRRRRGGGGLRRPDRSAVVPSEKGLRVLPRRVADTHPTEPNPAPY